MNRIYIAGPIAGEPLEFRQVQFEEAEGVLEDAGFHPLNPMKEAPVCDGSCQGLKEREEDAHARSCYLKWDIISMLLHCDKVALLPGWDLSSGALMEKQIAHHCGLDARTLAYWLRGA